MSRYRVEVKAAKCQSYGKCLALAPSAFAWDRARKVRLSDPGSVPDETLLKAAKLCPYRAITIIDNASGAQLFPPPRTS